MRRLECVYCGTNLENIVGTQREYVEDKVIIINNVPFVRCSKCNEEYIQPDVMEIINKIVLENMDLDQQNITVDFNSKLEDIVNDSKK